jgi:acetylornithine deacetylase/succinyl-diaminopimelate desuccinylase-like protein
LHPDVIVISDTSMFQKDLPTICYGLRGLAAAEITVFGASRDLHSGSYGGTVVNPIHVLAEILAALHDKDGRVAVPGFYDDVEPLEAWERQAWADLPWSDGEYRRNLGLDRLYGEPGYSTLERCWGRPTLEINGIYGGFMGHGSKTVIPCRASAKISCRLVPNQNPFRVLDQIEGYIKSLELHAARVDMTRHSAGEPVRLETTGPWIEALKVSLAKGFGREPVFIREGGSIPIVSLLQEEFGVPILLAGFARPDCRAHGPDEYLSLTDYERAIRTAAILLDELGKPRKALISPVSG